VTRSAMEWHRNPPWMACQSVKPEEQDRATNKSVNPEQQGKKSPPTQPH